MGTGRSGAKKKAGGGAKNFPNAFDNNGLSFDEERQKWEEFEREFGTAPTRDELRDIGGYVATGASFGINRKLYTPGMGEEALTESEKKTVSTLDRMVDTHVTPRDAKFTRYVDRDGAAALLGMDSNQRRVFEDAVERVRRGDKDALDQLNKAIAGSRAHSDSFTSTSATPEHLFSSRLFKREINVKQGTKAFATNNRGEYEVVFGRKMNTSLAGVSFDGRHIIFHEDFESYDK